MLNEHIKICIVSWNFIVCSVVILIYKILPTSVNTLYVFSKFLSKSFKAVQLIQNYISGVKSLYLLLDLASPVENTLQLKLLLRGIARGKQHVPRKAEPVSPTILREIHHISS